jgi:hypothetical protein
MASVIQLREYFNQGYLESLQKSDFEVIAGMIERDLKVVILLPREQQLKIAETMHSVVGEIIARNIPALKE